MPYPYPTYPAQVPTYVPQYTPQYPQNTQTGQQINNTPISPTPEPQKPQVQYSFMMAPSVEVARDYPVAPGNTVNFLIENQPYLCTKSMGFSPFEGAKFEKCRIVKEEETPAQEPKAEEAKPDYVLKEDFEKLEGRMDEFEKLLKATKKKSRKDDEVEDDAV